MSFIILKNKLNEYYTLDSIVTCEPDCYANKSYVAENFPEDRIHKQEYAACIWPLVNGYARFIGKNGIWGFLHEYTQEPFWLAKEVLYADDFSCGLARIQYVDGTYNYLNSHLKHLSDDNYNEASIFSGGYAIVSDNVCINYQIDINGNVSEKDKNRYDFALKCKMEDDDINWKETHRNQNNSVFDPESSIMNSLSGCGPDPEDYGF